jgi:hypothetical protein
MPRYFFDTRTDDRVVPDDDGIFLNGLDAARAQATEALADMARDVLPKERAHTLSVEVRDETGRQVIKASVWSEVQVLA